MTRKGIVHMKPKPAGVFEVVWPVTDQDVPANELLAVARSEFFEMAAKKRLLLDPPTVTWAFRELPDDEVELVYRADATRVDDIFSMTLGHKRKAAA